MTEVYGASTRVGVATEKKNDAGKRGVTGQEYELCSDEIVEVCISNL